MGIKNKLFDTEAPLVKINLLMRDQKIFTVDTGGKYKLFYSKNLDIRVLALKLQHYSLSITNTTTQEIISVQYKPFGYRINSFSRSYAYIGTLYLAPGEYLIKIEPKNKGLSLNIPPMNIFGSSTAASDDYYEITN